MMPKHRNVLITVNPAFEELLAELQGKLAIALKQSISRTKAIEFGVAIAHAHLHSPYAYGSSELERDIEKRLHYNFGLLRGAEPTWKLEDIRQPDEVRK